MGLFDWVRKLLGRADRESLNERQMRQVALEFARRRESPSLPPSGPPNADGPAPKDKTLGLDVGKFKPLAHEQVREQAGQLGSAWGNPFFGRRDLIPPTSDARTELIDRAMVGRGLISPEELASIHAIGDEMDRVRPNVAIARTEADGVIQAGRDAREARKAQKKAEAAERRAKRAAAIAQRRATDIVFLGRGVSYGLADRRANVERLSAQGLPVLASPADVAQALGITIGQLRWLAFHSDASRTQHYIRFDVPKKSGGTRTLAAPNAHIKRCQRWIVHEILNKVAIHDAAHGFVQGRSIVSNATPHVGRAVLVNADLSDFFPSITFPRVRGVLQGLGYSPAAATVLALICTEAPRRPVTVGATTYYVAAGPRALPQGAPTSPALSNMICRRLDARFRGMGNKLGFTYTRYADDLSFSTPDPNAREKIGYLLARVRHICQDEGFAVNEKKTRVLRRHTAQTVTGIVVNDRPAASRKRVRRLRAILHQAGREGLAAQNRTGRPNYEAWLRGQIAFVSMVNPDQGRPLREAFDALV